MPLLIVVAAGAVAAVLLLSGGGGAEPGSNGDRRAQAPSGPRPASCMPKPSACGYPDATNTGVPPGTSLDRVDGTVTIDKPGTVYSGHEVHGEILVAADDVTIENTRIVSTSDYPIRMFDVAPDPPRPGP